METATQAENPNATRGDKTLSKGQVKAYSALVEILSDILQVSFFLSLMCKYASVTSKHLATQNLHYLESTFVSVIDGTCTLDSIPNVNCTAFAVAEDRFCGEVELEPWEVFMGVMFGNAFFLAYFDAIPDKSSSIVFFPGEATVFPYLLSGILLSVPTLMAEGIELLKSKCTKSEVDRTRNSEPPQSVLDPERGEVSSQAVSSGEAPRILGCLDFLFIAFFAPLWPIAHLSKLIAINTCSSRVLAPPLESRRGLTPKLFSYTSLLFDLIRTLIIWYVFGATIVMWISLALNIVSFFFHYMVMGHEKWDFICFAFGALCIVFVQFGFGIYIACFLLYLDFGLDFFTIEDDAPSSSQRCPFYQCYLQAKALCSSIKSQVCRCCIEESRVETTGSQIEEGIDTSGRKLRIPSL